MHNYKVPGDNSIQFDRVMFGLMKCIYDVPSRQNVYYT